MLKKSVKNWRKDSHSIDKFKFIYHFLPHPEQNKRATLLSSKSITLYIFLIVILMGIFRFMPKVFPGVLGYASDINITDLFNYTNKEREQFNLQDLQINEKLSEAAKAKAEHMFAHNYWAHVSPEGTEPWDFILAEKYDYVYAGENLAKNFSTSKDVIQAWHDSPSHRDNLLNKNYNEVGFAVVNGVLDGYDTTLVVQMFGKAREEIAFSSKEQETRVLEKISAESATTVSGVTAKNVTNAVTVDVDTTSKWISISFSLFIVLLLLLDVWYSRKKGIIKVTGHSFAHLTLLLFLILSVWFVLQPGKIL